MTEKLQIWFPAKKYGYGWGLPCAWQGWVVMLVYVLLLSASVVFKSALHINYWAWLAAIFVLSFGLALVCWWKGEKPAWRWGNKE